MAEPENPAYTFDAFIVGTRSREAWTAAVSAAANSCSAYNPLFLYGPTGSGKTHLLHAIAHDMRCRRPQSNILRIATSTHATCLIDAIRADRVSAFRESLKVLDALLLDDIRVMPGKPMLQEEIFRQIADLALSGIQVVATSDVPPNDLAAQLETRRGFEHALSVELGYPDRRVRSKLRRRAAATRRLLIRQLAVNRQP